MSTPRSISLRLDHDQRRAVTQLIDCEEVVGEGSDADEAAVAGTDAVTQ
jgi:hypothetical protein